MPDRELDHQYLQHDAGIELDHGDLLRICRVPSRWRRVSMALWIYTSTSSERHIRVEVDLVIALRLYRSIRWSATGNLVRVFAVFASAASKQKASRRGMLKVVGRITKKARRLTGQGG